MAQENAGRVTRSVAQQDNIELKEGLVPKKGKPRGRYAKTNVNDPSVVDLNSSRDLSPQDSKLLGTKSYSATPVKGSIFDQNTEQLDTTLEQVKPKLNQTIEDISGSISRIQTALGSFSTYREQNSGNSEKSLLSQSVQTDESYLNRSVSSLESHL